MATPGLLGGRSGKATLPYDREIRERVRAGRIGRGACGAVFGRTAIPPRLHPASPAPPAVDPAALHARRAPDLAIGAAEEPAPPAPETLRYGALPDQVGDLHRPALARPPVVVLLHGGFWRMPYAYDQTTAMARDLARRGYAAWNLEYRRIGEGGFGWPATFTDVAAGIDFLAELAARGTDLDLSRVTTVGHSAGGHLALWAAARGRFPEPPLPPPRVRVAAVAALAPLADLARVDRERLGGRSVQELLGASLDAVPGRLRATSPIALLPLGVPQLLLHGADDDIVPLAHARDYASAAAAAGDAIEFRELPATGHFDFLDPASPAHAALVDWLGRTLRPAP